MANMADVRRALLEHRERHQAHIAAHAPGCECRETMERILGKFDDAREVYELGLYAGKAGDVETARMCTRTVRAFVMSMLLTLETMEPEAKRAQTERWMAEAEREGK